MAGAHGPEAPERTQSRLQGGHHGETLAGRRNDGFLHHPGRVLHALRELGHEPVDLLRLCCGESRRPGRLVRDGGRLGDERTDQPIALVSTNAVLRATYRFDRNCCTSRTDAQSRTLVRPHKCPFNWRNCRSVDWLLAQKLAANHRDWDAGVFRLAVVGLALSRVSLSPCLINSGCLILKVSRTIRPSFQTSIYPVFGLEFC